MTDSYALLAEPTSTGDMRRWTLKSDTAAMEARAMVMAGHRDLLALRLWLGGTQPWLCMVLDDRGFVPVRTRGATDGASYQAARAELAMMGYRLADGGDYWLVADHAENGRRTSVVKDDVGIWSMRVKVIQTDEDDYLQLRVWHARRGYIHIVIHEAGSLVAIATGGNDSDAWDRLRGELKRRDIDVD